MVNENFRYNQVQKPIAKNTTMRNILDKVTTVSPFDENIFISGESGTGKSMLARWVHRCSSRSDESFVEVNCSSLHENLLESELFGHVKGSFTGALHDRIGKLEEAQNGTIFFDDITSASSTMQAKLLHVFEERVIQPVGSNNRINLDVRFICASNKDLRKEISEGRFREDLFYRTFVVDLHLPALRNRTEDILPLTQHFIDSFNRKYQKYKIRDLTEEGKVLALSYNWPGNVRELKNVIIRSIMMSKSEYVDCYFCSSENFIYQSENLSSHNLTLREMLASHEREIIIKTLCRYNWCFPIVYKTLGISRSTLFNKIKSYRLEQRQRKSELKD